MCCCFCHDDVASIVFVALSVVVVVVVVADVVHVFVVAFPIF